MNGAGDRPVHVLTLLDVLGAGGAETLAVELSAGLDPARFRSTVCVTRRPNPGTVDAAWRRQEAKLNAAGVTFMALPRDRRLHLAAWAPLVRYMRANRVDVLHAHAFGSSVWGAIVAKLCRVPVFIAHDHGWTYESAPVRMFVDRELIARASSAFVAVSPENRQLMVERERIPADKAIFVANGCPTIGPGTGGDVRGELGLGPDVPVVGTVCALRAQKALEVLFRAALILRDEFPALRVLVAGRGPERERLDALIVELGLGDTVTMLGLRTGVADVLAALDVAVNCSDWEGTPIAVMEFMEAARPIVATRVGGSPDLIDDGVHGRLVPPRDPAALAAAVAELLRDPERARKLGTRARERQQREFSMQAMIERFEALYLELLGDRTAR